MKAILPTRALAVFLFIGFLDLAVTAWLHSRGLIVELNPIMRIFLDRGEWLFATVKGLGLIAGWAALAWYGSQNKVFVRKVCVVASIAYVTIWVAWFTTGVA